MEDGIVLTTPLERIDGIGPRFLRHLQRLGVKTVRDLLFHFPTRYEDFSEIYSIDNLEPGQQATIQGVVRTVSIRRSWRRHLTIVEAILEDDTGSIRAVWFNQPYIRDILRPGRFANFAGKVSISSENELYLNNPTYELTAAKKETADEASAADWRHTGRLVPVYPETRGLTSKGIRFLVQPLLRNVETIPEFIPEHILEEQRLPEINQALRDIHFPETLEASAAAKKRFAFEDLFLLQLLNFSRRNALSRQPAPQIETSEARLRVMQEKLPFELTVSQKGTLAEILGDLERPHPMNRLLQGDVGSGKTVVAALAAFAVAEAGFQAAFMAPTEVLARQHFETLKKLVLLIYPPHSAPAIGLLVSSEAKIFYGDNLEGNLKKSEMQQKIKSGEIKVVVGTHALIQKSVGFNNLALVIVDEQHRFGVNQRAELVRRSTQIQKITNADAADNSFLFKELTYKIRGAAFAVYNALGPGLKESIYQKSFEEEIRNLGLEFMKEKTIEINYHNKKVGSYRPDFIVENKVIVEIKAVSFLGRLEEKQIWSYLKGSEYKIALLINFGGSELAMRRIVFDTARNQRKSASNPHQSAFLPHLLSMSATPIPRTLMLTVFGDLDLSLITELPAGRKNILTKIVAPENRPKAYAFIRGQAQKGRQVFVICPRIEPQNNADAAQNTTEFNISYGSAYRRWMSTLEVKSVKEEYEKLSKKVFPDLRVAMLHGQMPAKGGSSPSGKPTKESVMRDFKNGEVDVLVATSVVEVGVDVPNATIMMIEGSDRFGLAQLYQFRGRVGRGEHQSFCFLFSESNAKTTQERLKAIVEAKNGFELAEKDLKLRGPGQFLGEAQTGFPDLAMRSLEDITFVKSSREAALRLLEDDRDLRQYPFLKARLREFQKKLHPE